MGDFVGFFFLYFYLERTNHLSLSFSVYLEYPWTETFDFDVIPSRENCKKGKKFSLPLICCPSGVPPTPSHKCPVGVVRAGSCPGCPGPSRRSWCPSPSRPRCARPPPGFSLVSACGWRSGEPAGPGSRSGRAFRQTGPGLGSRREGRERLRGKKEKKNANLTLFPNFYEAICHVNESKKNTEWLKQWPQDWLTLSRKLLTGGRNKRRQMDALGHLPADNAHTIPWSYTLFPTSMKFHHQTSSGHRPPNHI